MSDTLSNQQKLVTSFNGLLKKFEPLIKIADEVAKVRCPVSAPSLDDLNRPFPPKIHPYVNFAWQVLSAGMKVSYLNYSAPFLYTHLFDQMVQAQQARDVKILGLVTTMEDTFSFAVSADELQSHPILQDIMEEILKQTIECGYFIQVYTRSEFGGTWYTL